MSAVMALLGPAALASGRTWGQVRAQILALGAGLGTIDLHSERAWASNTFTGSLHAMTLRFEGYEAVAAGETLRACLPEHEFSIPGQLVADASVVRAEHHTGATPTLTIDLELLILEHN
ncbi:MAG: hypothetical protein MK010_00195 [Erythrobacter sp.]|nr:hypothetical protein [Erythrobacter sp.]